MEDIEEVVGNEVCARLLAETNACEGLEVCRRELAKAGALAFGRERVVTGME